MAFLAMLEFGGGLVGVERSTPIPLLMEAFVASDAAADNGPSGDSGDGGGPDF